MKSNFKDVLSQSLAELGNREMALRQELLEMRFEHAVGKLHNTSAVKLKRRDLARVLTAVNAKKVEA